MTRSGSLRVALLAPPWLPVPPGGYGGIELVVYLLARELHARGHEVTIFARQGSSAELDVVALAPGSWKEHLGSRDERARECLHVYRAYEVVRRRAFDVVHDHTGFTGMTVGAALRLAAPVVATLHGDLTEADGELLGALEQRVALVAITASQQNQVAGVGWSGVVHNAVDAEEFHVSDEKDDYLLQLARITPDKGQHLAIEVARRLGRPLVLAGKVDPAGQTYFREQIEPQLGEDVRWIEDVQGEDKARLLARARAMLFPIQWEEPFGLAMVEAMASGTPVVAMRNGAAPELIEEGETGFLGDDVDDLVEGVRRSEEIDPGRCAGHARERFSPTRMADGYEDVYRRAIERRSQMSG
ncbi:MAG: glycosyltransferase family 4 protein [Chloroflexi bacterium]|nr:MAG: glycosyltransferase family 4 protein [Chloroflexota bacterium]